MGIIGLIPFKYSPDPISVFLLILFILFLFSKRVISDLSIVFFRIFRSKKISYSLFTLIFFPGTFIHELSHYLFALILFVPVKKIDLKPVYEKNSITLGSVSISKKNPFRSGIIALAPLIVGIFLLWLLVFQIRFIVRGLFFTIFYYYSLFQIANSMFISSADLKSMKVILVILVLIVLSVVFFNIPILKIAFLASLLKQLRSAAPHLSTALKIPILLDIGVIFLTSLVKKVT